MEVHDEIVDNFLSKEEENNPYLSSSWILPSQLWGAPIEILKEECKNEVIINIIQSKAY